MQYTSTAALFLSVLSLSNLVSSRRKYERRAMRNLMAGQALLEQIVENDGGYSPLPPKASYSQCALALERIVKQPQSCAMKYLSAPARNVYSPIYNWFTTGDEVTIEQVAQQFAFDNGVGVEVYDAFGNEIAQVDENGNILPVDPNVTVGFELARTWALNYATFVREEESEEAAASIAQNVWNVRGELLTVVISKPVNVLPVVC